MRKAVVPLAFVAVTSLAACSFSMRAGSANQPQSGSNQPPPGAAPAPSPQPSPGGPSKQIGKAKLPPGSTTTAPTATTAPTGTATPTVPPGVPVVTGTTTFGSGTPDASGYKGSIYRLPAGTTKLPALASMQPNGFVFIRELNIPSRAFTEGFPGVDAALTQNFALRYEAPLIVDNEADYDFRIVSDDGSTLSIDGMKIVDNDGAKSAASEKTGPVHLVRGTHAITIDYFQTSGNVALQVFCKKRGEAEKVCPTRL